MRRLSKQCAMCWKCTDSIFYEKYINLCTISTHTFVAHWMMFCLHCLGVMRNMKAREMLNYLHHLEFKFPAAATRYSPSLHPAEPSCVARIIPRHTVWRIREMISRSWLGPAVEEHFGKITKPCHATWISQNFIFALMSKSYSYLTSSKLSMNESGNNIFTNIYLNALRIF